MHTVGHGSETRNQIVDSQNRSRGTNCESYQAQRVSYHPVRLQMDWLKHASVRSSNKMLTDVNLISKLVTYHRCVHQDS